VDVYHQETHCSLFQATSVLMFVSLRLSVTHRRACSGGARGHPDEGAAFPDGGAETPRAAAAPPLARYGAETSGFIAFGQLRVASPATICRICNG